MNNPLLLLLVLAVPLVTPAHADEWDLVVPATANVYGAGHAVAPGPDGNGGGTLPPVVALPVAAHRVLRIVNASGSIRYNSSLPFNGPDGVAWSPLAFDWDGLAGCRVNRARHLSGVLLGDGEPANPPPATLLADSLTFVALWPQLRQIFPIGDGLTATAAGDTQRFVIPDAATRLFLGFVDSYSGTQPGWYGDNSGSLAVGISVTVEPTTAVGPTGAGGFRVLPALGDARGGGTRVRFVMPAGGTVRVEVFDTAGRLVRDLGAAEEPAGLRERLWDGHDGRGAAVAAGVYFARVRAPSGSGSARCVLF